MIIDVQHSCRKEVGGRAGEEAGKRAGQPRWFH